MSLSGETLQRWLFTGGTIIDEGARIPHSHPVLTLNTRIEGDVDLLSVLVHEQLHWFANEKEDAVEEAVLEFRQIFPEVPVRGHEGARDEYSSYLHLVVCDLEPGAEAVALVREKRLNGYAMVSQKSSEQLCVALDRPLVAPRAEPNREPRIQLSIAAGRAWGRRPRGTDSRAVRPARNDGGGRRPSLSAPLLHPPAPKRD